MSAFRFGVLVFAAVLGVHLGADYRPAPDPEQAAAPIGVWHLEPNVTVPARVTRVIDGDTVEVQICIKADVRLLDCWAPETRTLNREEKSRGLAAKDYLSELVADEEVLLCVPLPEGGGDLGSVLTFGRILGHLYMADAGDGRTVSEMMVEAGHATRERPE